MRLRTFTVSLAVAAAATLPLAGVAAAQPADRDCADFSSQEEAQDALLPGDPERLDEDDDGEACENYDYGSSTPPADDEDEASEDEDAAEDEDDTSDDEGDDSDEGQVSVVPQGGVDTGDGSSDAGAAPFLLAGVLAAGVAAGAARRRVHTSR